MTNDMGMGHSPGKMADSTWAIGRMAVSMEKECTSKQMERKSRASGKMAKIYDGLIKMLKSDI